MKPVMQSIVCEGEGDCMRAVIASLFDFDLDMVPHFIKYQSPHQYFQIFWDWLHSIGWDYNGCGYPHSSLKAISCGVPNTPKPEDSVNGYFYGCVPSRTFDGITHAIVIDTQGLVVHDPNPNKLWEGVNVIQSGDLKYWFLLGRKEVNSGEITEA
jgi:hypothetical protein